MTTLYLVRHGEAAGNVERNFHGHYDSDLTENGRRQIACLPHWFRDIPLDVVYTSDLKRTCETALVIADAKHLPLQKRADLREIHGGAWENVPWDDLPLRFPESYENWLHTPQHLQMPGGESMQEFQDRIYSAVVQIAAENEGKNVAVVTHGTAIKVLLCRIDGAPLSALPSRPWCDNASVTTLRFEAGQATILHDGDNAHLGALSTLAKQTWWRR